MPGEINASGPLERAAVAALAPVFRERFAEVAGGALRVLEGGEGPPLVLIHGRGNASILWAPILPALAREHRVLAVDLPGFGASRGYRFGGGGFAEGLAFFVDPIEAWLTAEGLGEAAIAGHSLGGLVAVELALRRRVRPAALALIGAMGMGPEITTLARLFFRAGPERLARWLGPRAFLRLLPPVGPDGARLGALGYELYAVPGGRGDASAAFDALVPLAGPLPHRRARLGEIEAPALVLWGEHDEVFPAPLAIAAAGALRRGQVQIIPAGHSPQQEEPARVAEMLGAFLTSGRAF